MPLRITQLRGTVGSQQNQIDSLRSLGLHRIRQTVEQPDTPQVRGYINRVRHLVEVEEF